MAEAPDQQPEGVGLVVVSHSRALAEAAWALAAEMLHDRPVRVELAAGLDDEQLGPQLGTDAVRVKEAIEAVDGPAGVLVLMDLGSAVLCAELALDLLEDPTARERVTLSGAPLVEGLVVAAVAAAGGADRASVAAQAADALAAKAVHLGGDQAAPAVGTTAPAAAATAAFTVSNEHGLHARPAARLVAEMGELDAEVWLTNRTTGAGPSPIDSMIQLALLGAERGHEVEVRASGPQAQQAVDRLLALAAEGFGDGLG